LKATEHHPEEHMSKYRHALPQLGQRLFLTDGGIETTLIFHEGFELRDFAVFDLVTSEPGEAALRQYFREYAVLASTFNTGLILESPTWRANRDWAQRLGYTPEALAEANRHAIQLLGDIRAEFETDERPIVISGCLGPRGDGYIPDAAMSTREAEAYHNEQVTTFAATEADMVSAMTINYVAEAVGIVRAARQCGIPVAVSFTVETDGRLPTGQSLRSAIEQTDAATAGYAAYYAINCAHPEHIAEALADRGSWVDRLHGLRANASRKSHAELNESPDLDCGDPEELARDYLRLRASLPRLNVMGGCCGTDSRHVGCIAAACTPVFRMGTAEDVA
jgi:S-methylmethionine-dependent homocysteine/selenocysteine methylase